MKTSNLYLFLSWIAFALTPAPFVGATENTAPNLSVAGTATISGRVQNVVTGKYLNRARVSIKGSDLMTYTDESGIYRLVGVRRGNIVLQAFYTDLDAQEIPLTVAEGAAVEQDIALTSVARYGQDAKVVILDPFLVASNKETDATAIATNEQRFAPNIKNVIATDELGDVFGSNAGDFLKFLPGLVAEYDNADVYGISVRGMGADKTNVTIDGMPVSTGSQTGPTRRVQIQTLALNNLTRLEVAKVPTPSSPADSLAGAINMVGKSAFERSTAELRYGLILSGNGHALTLRKTPHGYLDKNTYKIQPGFDFDYTLPIRKNFGVVVTGMESNKFVYQDLSTTTWTAAGTGTGASISQPFFQQFISRSFPRYTVRGVYSVKADWRVTPNSVLSLGGRWSRWVSARSGGFRLAANAGNNGTPTPATGRSFSYGTDFTNGATGRATVSLIGEWQYGKVFSSGADLNYRFDNGEWKIESSLSLSEAEAVVNPSRGPVFFNNVTAVTRVPVRLSFSGVSPNGPKTIQAFNNNNQEVDLYDINNYVFSSATQQIR